MRTSRTATRTLLLLVGLASAAEPRAADPRGAVHPDLILQRFAVARGGDGLLIPVKIAGKDRLFVVDTGCTNTVVDSSLPLGNPLGEVDATTSAGEDVFRIYGPPDASIGGVPLRLGAVAGFDMKRYREVSGHPIEGWLGMDFLGRHIVHVNFDRGELLLLKSVPKDAGQEVPLTWEPGGIPEVEASVTGEKNIRYHIDTGAVGRDSGRVEVLEARSLAGEGEFRGVGSTLEEPLQTPPHPGCSRVSGCCWADSRWKDRFSMNPLEVPR